MTGKSPTPFTIEIPQGKLDAIMAKVRAYEWHEMPEIAPGADRWAYGTDMEYMRELCTYWAEKFDWRAAEKALDSEGSMQGEPPDVADHSVPELVPNLAQAGMYL